MPSSSVQRRRGGVRQYVRLAIAAVVALFAGYLWFLRQIFEFCWSLVPSLVEDTTPYAIASPAASFLNLKDYRFRPNFIHYQGLRVHYVDEGPRNAKETVVLLHGEPTWSYLYRKMIPGLAQRYRVIAPDMIGFGKSDKLVDEKSYSPRLMMDVLKDVFEANDLKNVTLVVQDWGGIFGLSIVPELDSRISRLVIMNTALPPMQLPLFNVLAFLTWRSTAGTLRRQLPVGRLMKLAVPSLDADEMYAYDAPFPTWAHKAGVVRLPEMVPLSKNFEMFAYTSKAKNWFKQKQYRKPVLVMFSDKDPMTSALGPEFVKLFPHAKQVTVKGAGHFLQEQKPQELVSNIIKLIDSSA
eukprot:Clim_evm42s214 gene=Clim_evmTU42s214